MTEAMGKSPIRVLRVQSRICIGGPALNTINLSAGLEEFGYQTLLVGGRLEPNETSMEPDARERKVAIKIIPEMGRSLSPFDDIKALLKLIKLIKKFQPDIIHTHTAKAGALGRIAGFLCRIPVRVHTFHGHVFKGYFSGPKTSFIIWVERFLARLTHRIVTISKLQFHDLSRVYKITSEKKLALIPLGFQLDKITSGEKGRLKSSLNLAENTALLGILARLVPIKNHDFLLESLAVWKSEFYEPACQDVRILIIGDGPLREELETKSKALGLDDIVIFTGWKRNIDDIYADLNLNILVSKNEGTPVTLIEGMAAGVPILAKEAGGIRDIAPKGSGTILPQNCTHQDMAKALHDFLQHPARLTSDVSEAVIEQFHVRRLVKDMNHLYEGLLAKRRLNP